MLVLNLRESDPNRHERNLVTKTYLRELKAATERTSADTLSQYMTKRGLGATARVSEGARGRDIALGVRVKRLSVLLATDR